VHPDWYQIQTCGCHCSCIMRSVRNTGIWVESDSNGLTAPANRDTDAVCEALHSDPVGCSMLKPCAYEMTGPYRMHIADQQQHWRHQLWGTVGHLPPPSLPPQELAHVHQSGSYYLHITPVHGQCRLLLNTTQFLSASLYFSKIGAY